MENSILPIQRLKNLLRMEYEAEREEYRQQTEKMSLRRKVRRGICWYPVALTRTYYNSLNQLVADIEKVQPETDDAETEDGQDIEHNFEYGKPVVFFTTPAQESGHSDSSLPPLTWLPFTSQVSYADDNRMVVTLPSTQAVIDLQNQERPLGVQLYFDETSFRTMFHALDDVLKARSGRIAELRDIFTGLQQPHKFTFSPLRFPWLNATQELAVNEVLRAKDVAIVHGPPGTGKTTTLVEAIHETLRRETQVLVCAQSNLAVDWICEKLVDYGISVLRIGNPTRVNDKMLSFTYERKFENHPDYPELWSIRKAIRQLREHRKKGENTHQKLARLRERADEIEMRIHTALFSEVRVIASTLVGSASKMLVGQKFSTLFIDEAAQALEPACWIAIRRAGRVILAGDHQQLPPTVKSNEARKQGLGITLMERIVGNVPQAVTLLTMQYRMNEQIMRFSSDWFYHGAVESAPQVKYRSILDLDHPIEWLDTSQLPDTLLPDDTSQPLSFQEEFVGENHGRVNKAEAEITVAALQRYIEKIGRQRFLDERLDIGIISPYRVQTHYLRHLIKQRGTLAPFRSRISINTVDGFQGQERDIILISLVRSNANGKIGFLHDLRRMNVAMTRARMKLIIIANAPTLVRHPFYRRLKQYIDDLHEAR